MVSTMVSEVDLAKNKKYKIETMNLRNYEARTPLGVAVSKKSDKRRKSQTSVAK